MASSSSKPDKTRGKKVDKEGRVRAIVIETLPDYADALYNLMLYEGYRNMREFVLRTLQYRYQELQELTDYELRPKVGRSKHLHHSYRDAAYREEMEKLKQEKEKEKLKNV